MMWGWIALAVFIVFIIILYMLSPLISPLPMKLQNAHVLVTGGSSGIGRALAIQAVQQGARVTLVARNKEKLEEAKTEVAAHVTNEGKEQQVQVISVDLSSDYQTVETAFQNAERDSGAVDFLINCAGTSSPGRFEELPISDFKAQKCVAICRLIYNAVQNHSGSFPTTEGACIMSSRRHICTDGLLRMIDINYMSAVHATRAIIPTMKARGQGRIVFVSSQAGQLGLFGFTAYSASKFALRGLAEALQMEVKPYNIYLTLAFPPDTNTPGFQEEQKTKPHETKLISETSGLFSAENVASKILSDAVKGSFFSSMGLDGVMLSNLTCGFSPVTSLMEATQQVVTMGIFRIISLFYLAHFDSIVRKCKLQRDFQKESKKVS